MSLEVSAGPGLEIAIALAARRGWDHEVLSPDRVFLTVPSRRHPFRYGGVIVSARGMWRVRLSCDLSLSEERREATRAALEIMNAGSLLAFALSPDGDLAISLEESFLAAEPPSTADRLERRIDTALDQLALCRHMLLLVNWTRKSPLDALAAARAHAGSEMSARGEKLRHTP